MSDVRRPDLAIPYVHKPDVTDNASSSILYRSLPMVAMFMRSKILAWAGLFLSVQAYLTQPPTATADESVTVSNILTSIMGLGVAYMDFIVSPGGARAAAPAAPAAPAASP